MSISRTGDKNPAKNLETRKKLSEVAQKNIQNGTSNIFRKVIGNDFINLVNRGCVDQPVKVQLSQMKEFKDLTNFISF